MGLCKLKKIHLIIKNNIKNVYFNKYFFYLEINNYIFFYKNFYYNIKKILPSWLLIYKSFYSLLNQKVYKMDYKILKNCVFNFYFLKLYLKYNKFYVLKKNIYFNLLKNNHQTFKFILMKKTYIDNFFIRYYFWIYFLKFLNKNTKYIQGEPKQVRISLVKMIKTKRFIEIFKLNIDRERSFYKLRVNIRFNLNFKNFYKFFYNIREEVFFLTCVGIVLNETEFVIFNNKIFGSKNLLFNMESVYTYLYEYFILKNIVYLNNFFFWTTLQRNFNESYLLNKLSLFTGSDVNFNNCMPYIFFNKLKRKSIALQYYLIKYSGLNWILISQLNKFISNIVNTQVTLIIKKNGEIIIDEKVVTVLKKQLMYKRPPFQNNYFINELVDIFFYASLYKSSEIIYNWIARNLNIIFFKKQPSLISFLKSAIRVIYPVISEHFGVLGLKVKFKGKIGKVGSFRKKRFIIREGMYSYSNINLRLVESKGQVFTDTGVIGLQIILSY